MHNKRIFLGRTLSSESRELSLRSGGQGFFPTDYGHGPHETEEK